MQKDRLLIPESSSNWHMPPETERLTIATIYRVHDRSKGKFKPASKVAGRLLRITADDAAGELLMELTNAELTSAQALLAHAAVESENYVNGDDKAAQALVAEPRYTPACLEFRIGRMTVAVTFLGEIEDAAIDSRRGIRLSSPRTTIQLPHFNCLA